MRIILLEDEPNLGAAIERTLKQQKYIVDWVTDGKEAWDYLEDASSQYTVCVFDWLVPQLSGIELVKKMRQNKIILPVLMLTAKDTMEDKIVGLDAGADDYLIKPFGMEELLARIRALQRRSPQWQPQQLQVENFLLDCGKQALYHRLENKESKEILLTNKEFQLIEYFFNHPQQIISSDRLRNCIWEVDSDAFSNVVAAQIRLLRRKLEAVGCHNAIETIRGLGYRFNGI
jgi:DNA-binding response OmpR family regulator